MRRSASCFLPIFLLCSCSISQLKPLPAATDGELYFNPQLLTDRSVGLDGLRLWNVKLGDPASAVADSRIHLQADHGWLRCRDGSRYRVENGTVVALGVWDPNVLAKLQINSPDDILSRFGPTSRIDVAQPLRIYRYRDGKLAVIWNEQEKQINAVNISR